MRRISTIITIVFSLFFYSTCFAQDDKSLEREADTYFNNYEFGKALALYKGLFARTEDSTARFVLEGKMVLCENGTSLLDFVFEPSFEAIREFPLKNFFLHYPGFGDSTWIKSPFKFEKAAGASGGREMYYPSNSGNLYFSLMDGSGKYHIYTSHRISDSLWSAPSILNGNITSSGNEIFPVLGNNGKTLYFSSDGHYGIGGYDLYRSDWDPSINDWGVAQNMGIPYSSTGNDYLYYNTPDGLYTVFASDRDAGKGNVKIYVTDFVEVPLRKKATPKQASAISRPVVSTGKNKSGEKSDGDSLKINVNGNDGIYFATYKKVKALRLKIAESSSGLKKSRVLYNTLKDTSDLMALGKEISTRESKVLELQDSLGKAMEELQKVETDFLSKGIIVPETEDVRSRDDNPAASASGFGGYADSVAFSFADNVFGVIPSYIRVEEYVPPVDLSFRITETTELLSEKDFPGSLSYQVYLFSLAKKASSKAFKGLNPVFERKISSVKYSYAAGVFGTYEEASAHLPEVRKLGFRNARVIAYDGGKYISIYKAKILEKKAAENSKYRVNISGYPNGLPQAVLDAIGAVTDKDIAKTLVEGKVVFVIGVFGSETDAEACADAVKAVSDKIVKVEKIE
ncbi:MAG: hypothetical protein LKI53_00755 [Bacteroidales bacterium]|jgi:hypothetical protein|nr:hypothetical protein [Bacteroidales bacterium]